MDIQTVATRYANRKLKSKTIDLEEIGATIDTWLLDLLRTVSKKSFVNPIQSNELEIILKGLRLLSTNHSWKMLIRQHPRELRVDDLLDTYQELEVAIALLKLSANSSRQMFDGIRRHVKTYLEQRGDCPQVSMLRSFYPHTKFSFSKARQLISDQSFPGHKEDREPVGALRHSTVRELKAKIEKRLDGDLRKIQDACTKEIRDQFGVFDWLERISNEPRNLALKEKWDELAGRHGDVWRKSVRQFSERDLLREFLLRHALAPAFRPSLFAAYVDQGRILEYVAKETGVATAKRLASLVRSPHLLTSNLLVYFLILLQIHSCWNVSSVLELTMDCIKKEGAGFLIQGFKSRTNSQTPKVWIFPRDGIIFDCVEMLLSRVMYLKNLGRIASDENRIWMASRRSNSLNTQILSGFSSSLKNLIDKHSLPIFSFEQIRVQCLARIYVSEGGLEAARRSGGHASIRTTAHYLDQLLLNRLNCAINLEFQRRLEENVRYRIASVGGARASCFDEEMLYPVGDGTMCSQPAEPPNASWLQDGVCKAENCHIDGGCPNSKLTLDAPRIEEIALTMRFYENNWQRLASQNIDAFRGKHLPAMLFNMALHGFVSKGPYGHLLRRVEAGGPNA
ncbi:hypothetical protein [Variovorax sp. AFSI2.2]|uniref:hypothetical protein n=1 Tax=Variovorax sp. AFSI2.2 TaxID=3384160 RepID=UPI003EB83DBA